MQRYFPVLVLLFGMFSPGPLHAQAFQAGTYEVTTADFREYYCSGAAGSACLFQFWYSDIQAVKMFSDAGATQRLSQLLEDCAPSRDGVWPKFTIRVEGPTSDGIYTMASVWGDC